ncbi:MAG TPA: tetratricopeptide repeat protein [Pyrinomonadaceae bacterium]|nr:tetratricopeptide repeat protein [Pyrinomonadaceae bacterium]
MTDWLRTFVLVLFSPLRGLRDIREQSTLAQSGLFALLVHGSFLFYLTWHYLRDVIGSTGALVFSSILQAAGALIFIAVVFVPLSLFFANLFERRAGFRLLMQQEYSGLLTTVFYAMTAASVIALALTAVGNVTGLLPRLATRMFEFQSSQPGAIKPEMLPGFDPRLYRPGLIGIGIVYLTLLVSFGIWATMAIRVVLRLSWLRSVFIVFISATLLFPAALIVMPIFTTILASPFLLLLVFLFLRGYLGEISRNHRARVAFKQNLEAATLNPADASAHYNLGLIHQQRGDLNEANESFNKAIEIDKNEVDAHYQLGRIARQQQRLGDAIRHFEQVVTREPAHSQYEIWREVGSTYIEAGQYEDARNALEQFLEHRPSDPEGLYLMGRAHAGLGDKREAASLMQACIEAVKTSPAYKYRTSKRWLNEAQQFIKSSQ